MQSKDEAVEIVVCLGSSCFARGNSENLDLLKKHVNGQGGRANVRLTGCLCQDQCKQSPNLTVGGESYHGVTPAMVGELLGQLVKGSHAAS